MTTKKRYTFIINVLYFAIIIGLVLLLAKYALGYVMPFIISFIIASLGHRMAKLIIGKRKIKHGAFSIIFTILFWILAMALISLLFYVISRQAASMLGNITSLSDNLNQLSDSIETWIEGLYSKLPFANAGTIDASIDSVTNAIISFATNLAGSIVTAATNIVRKLPAVLLFILAAFLGSIFLAGDYEKINQFIDLQMPPRMYSRYVFVKKFIFGTIGKYVKAYSIIMAVTLSELLISFSILKLNYAFLLALLIMIFDLLPYVGCGTILFPWAAVELILGDYRMFIGILITAIVIAVVRNILEPKVVGKTIGIHPIIVLMSIYIGGKILGVAGVILLPVSVIFIKALKDEGYIKAWKSIRDKEKERENDSDAAKTPDEIFGDGDDSTDV